MEAGLPGDDASAGNFVSPAQTADKPKSLWQSALDTVTAATATTLQSAIAAIPKPGAPKVLAEPVPNRAPDGGPSILQLITDVVNWIGKGISRIFSGGGQSNAQPTPDMNALGTQFAPTFSAQLTQTAEARPTLTPTPTLQPTMTPTSMPKSMWVTYPANFHMGDPEGPIDNNDFPNGVLPLSVVHPTGKVKTGSNGYTYMEVTIDGHTGWVVSNLLELSGTSAPLSIDVTKKVTVPEVYQVGGLQAQDLRIGLSSPDPSTGKVGLINTTSVNGFGA